MSDLSEILKKLKYDKRMINWNLRQKILTPKEHKKHLKELPDLSNKKEEVNIKIEKPEDKKNQQEESAPQNESQEQS